VKHARGLIIAPASERVAIDLPWVVAALLLSIPSGWTLPAHLSSGASDSDAFVGAAAAPLAIVATTLLHFLLVRTTFVGKASTSVDRRIVLAGSTIDGYQIDPNAESEFRREFKVAAVMFGMSVAALIPLLLRNDVPLPPGATVFLLTFAIIGLLQVMPTFPFHGGYVFRAIFWYLHDNHKTGTRAAFLYSQLVASGALGFGVFFMIWATPSILLGFWCLLLGLLVLRASRSELLRATLIDRAGSIKASDALSGLNPTIRASAPLTEALDILLEQRDNGPALVRDRNIYIGMLNLAGIRRLPRSEWKHRNAAELVTPFEELVETAPGSDLLNVLRTLEVSEGTAVIVRDDRGEISGLVDRSMDSRALLRRGVARNLREAAGETISRNGRGSS
jgi:hypothetical protein